jgi:hypothetical protein
MKTIRFILLIISCFCEGDTIFIKNRGEFIIVK